MEDIANGRSWYWITETFSSTYGSMLNLVNGINTLKTLCKDTTLLGSFLENHDNPRFPSLTSDMALAKNAIAFTMLTDGIPIIYQGQEHHLNGSGVPQNREAIWLTKYDTSAPLYKFITALNQIRTWAIRKDSKYVTCKAEPVYHDTSTIVMRKGSNKTQLVSVLSNLGTSGPCYTLVLPAVNTGFSPNQSLVEVLGCSFCKTNPMGDLEVEMSAGAPRVFYPTSQLQGSGICPSLTSFSNVKPSSTVKPKACPTTMIPTSTCSQPASVAITFEDIVSTIYGQTIKVTGSVSLLANWSPANAIALSAANYTNNNHEWFGTVSGFAPGTVFQYKFINVAPDGTVTWEADPNHTFAVPTCVATAVIPNTWQT